MYGAVDQDEALRAVRHAIDCDINIFDVSPYYGDTLAEARLGEALRGYRDDVVLSTKCGRYGVDDFDFSPERITAGLEDSLRRLKTDRVDLLLAHDVEFWPVERIVGETLPAMRRLRAEGKAQYIGVSGYPLGSLVRVLEESRRYGGVDVVLTYCHHNALVRDIDLELVPVALKHGVGIVNASPMHMGVLGGKPIPSWHPAEAAVKAVGAAFAAKCREFGLDPGAAALAMSIDHDDIATTLCGMSTKTQVDGNCAALRLVIPKDLARELEAVVGPVRNRLWGSGLVGNYMSG
jgi:L-galactose dehydrogenase